MGTRIPYPEEIKWKTVEMKQSGISTKEIMGTLVIQNLAKEKGIITSMSRKGNCQDNAVIKSFHSSLKSEGSITLRRASISNSKVVKIVNQYMYYYNQMRIQANLNYLSPIEFAEQIA